MFPDLGAGLGLRPRYFQDALDARTPVDFWEVITENVMVAGGNPRRVVRAVRERAPIVLHGVSLSIGSADPLDQDYLARLARLVDELEPALVSDHLCWTTIDGRSGHDLWPLPYTERALEHVASRVHAVQDRLGCAILLENPASYVWFQSGELAEPEFLAELAARTGCGILLDVNNLHVSAVNHGWDPDAYLEALPPGRIGHIHVAGHARRGDRFLDTHDRPICDAVWELYATAVARFGAVATSIERDDHLPPLAELACELERIRAARTRTGDAPPPAAPRVTSAAAPASDEPLATEQRAFYAHVTARAPLSSASGAGEIYAEMYVARLRDALRGDFPTLRAALGEPAFDALAGRYIDACPPRSFTLRELGRQLPGFLRTDDVPAWAADLAELEVARLDAFDSADETPLARADAARLDPEAFAVLELRWIAASRRVTVRWDVERLWSEVDAGEAPSLPRPTAPHVILVWRPDLVVRQRVLDDDERALSDMLVEPTPLHELGAALGNAARLATLFGRWIDDGSVLAERGH